MGQMRFLVVAPDGIAEETLAQAYLTGIDRTPWLVQTSLEGDLLLLEREVSESANVHVPWLVEGYGLFALSTGTLMEQPDPYLLPVELARGIDQPDSQPVVRLADDRVGGAAGRERETGRSDPAVAVGRPCGRTSPP